MSYDSLMERMNGHIYHDYFMALCPFPHDGRLEQNPSLMVFEDGFYCKSCHRLGSLRALEKAITGNYQPDTTKKFLPQFKRWEKQFDGVADLAACAHKFLLRNPSYASYLKARKMEKFIKPGLFGFMDGWVTMPVRDKVGEIVDVVCRSTNPKFGTRYALMKVDKQTEPPIYCPDWHRIQEQEIIYIPFGMFDAWALYACGLATVTGTAGQSISSAALRDLGKNDYRIVPDKGEEPGAFDLASQLGWRGSVIRIDYPMGIKDTDEIYRKFGTTKLLHLLEN